MKYILTHERRVIRIRSDGRLVTLYRIKAIRPFTTYALRRKEKIIDGEKSIDYEIEARHIQVGQSGGFVQSEKNLSQEGICWIDDEAVAYGKSLVRDSAYLGGNAGIGDKVKLIDEAKVAGKIQVAGEITFAGRSRVVGEGTYRDRGVFKGVYIGRINQETTPPHPQNAVRVECWVNGKYFVNDLKF